LVNKVLVSGFCLGFVEVEKEQVVGHNKPSQDEIFFGFFGCRLELVDFEEATESMRCIGHASAGVASLAEFREHSQRQRQADEKAWALRDLLQSKGLSEPEIKCVFLAPLQLVTVDLEIYCLF
jgi:hypothetical protein